MYDYHVTAALAPNAKKLYDTLLYSDGPAVVDALNVKSKGWKSMGLLRTPEGTVAHRFLCQLPPPAGSHQPDIVAVVVRTIEIPEDGQGNVRIEWSGSYRDPGDPEGVWTKGFKNKFPDTKADAAMDDMGDMNKIPSTFLSKVTDAVEDYKKSRAEEAPTGPSALHEALEELFKTLARNPKLKSRAKEVEDYANDPATKLEDVQPLLKQLAKMHVPLPAALKTATETSPMALRLAAAVKARAAQPTP